MNTSRLLLAGAGTSIQLVNLYLQVLIALKVGRWDEEAGRRSVRNHSDAGRTRKVIIAAVIAAAAIGGLAGYKPGSMPPEQIIKRYTMPEWFSSSAVQRQSLHSRDVLIIGPPNDAPVGPRNSR
jgi:hypothetical protein